MSDDLINRPTGISCPECSLPTTPLNCGPIVVDFCRSCGGIWFDDREIGIFRAKLREFDLRKLKGTAGLEERRQPSICSCPRCGVVLEPFVYGVNTKVTPQRCGRCHGIWLDAIQLKAFLSLARITQEIEPHVRGLVKALEQERRDRAKWDRLGRLGDELNRGVHRRWYSRTFWNVWDFFTGWWPW